MWAMLRTPGEWPVEVWVRAGHKTSLILFFAPFTFRSFSDPGFRPLLRVEPFLLIPSSVPVPPVLQLPHPSTIISMSSKVFVGNLSFKTETEALREHFSAAGTVTEANIITRGPRSLGYGFVDFKTPADAE